MAANAYDEIPYSSQPHPQSHPDHLATLGRLFGLSPAPISPCRVLELGCAGGGNLIPMAFHLPESEFLGVELSGRQVEMAQQAIRDLNLRNVKIVHADLLEVDRSWGEFDYIISHGVYSWVPDEVQDRILTISSHNLAPQGIAYISYNTYPGWHMREMIRHMMLFHANHFPDPDQRIQQARALMDFLGRSVPTDSGPYGLLLQKELAQIRDREDYYIFHEYLERVNAPIYFHQFAERAQQHGLQYLADAEFATMLPSSFPKETAETLERISQDMIHTEQYMDFVRNRMFRRTLLCHEDLTLKRNLSPEDLTGLLVASAARPVNKPANLLPGQPQAFRTPQGASIVTDHPLTKAGLLVLSRQWPRAMDLDGLAQQALALLVEHQTPGEPDFQQDRKVLSEYLLRCYAAGGLEFHTWQADFVTEVSERPRIGNLATYLLVQGQPVVNPRHRVVELDHPTKRLCLALDGTRDRQAIVTHLVELAVEGTLVVRLDGDPLTNPDEIRDTLAGGLEHSLANVARAALLVA
jgi:methyltransferase-like protein/SAM-dependent methyltransferase